MRKTILGPAALLACILLISPLAGIEVSAAPIPIHEGDAITLSGLSPYGTIDGLRGGPYTATSPGGSFMTFCIELDEYLNFSSTFYVGGISTVADNGGKDTDGGDPLNPFTAWLYDKAISGDYFGSSELDDVQMAIWHEEGEISDLELGESKSFYDDHKAIFTSEVTDGLWAGLGGVKVINLVDGDGLNKQDILVKSVPEPGTLLLMGAGLIGLASVGRKRFIR